MHSNLLPNNFLSILSEFTLGRKEREAEDEEKEEECRRRRRMRKKRMRRLRTRCRKRKIILCPHILFTILMQVSDYTSFIEKRDR